MILLTYRSGITMQEYSTPSPTFDALDSSFAVVENIRWNELFMFLPG